MKWFKSLPPGARDSLTIFAVMLGWLLLLLSFSASAASKTWVYERDGLRVVLTDAPCAISQIMAQIPPELAGHLKGGSVTLRGSQPVTLCYLLRDGEVLIADENGASGYLPQSDFVESL